MTAAYTSEASIHAINQRVFETSLDLILVVERDGTMRRVSPSVQHLLGYRPEELVGLNATDFIHPDDLDRTRDEMRRARHTGVMRHFDCRYLHRDGRVVHLSWAGVWSELEGQHFFIGRDMSERIAAEQQLRHLQRMEAIGQLTGGLAHDFNNLLAVIIARIDLVIDEPALPPEVKEHIEAALHAAQRGGELTRQLLAFSRQQPQNPQLVDVNPLVSRAVSLLEHTMDQHVQVQFTPADRLWRTMVDPANLESAVMNLAVNARDAMPAGGRLLIETANATLDQVYARNNPGAAAGDYVSITVTDTGTGMSQDVVNRVFEPFFTTKGVGKGTGLGLSMVFGFVKQSEGHIKIYSEMGHGTSIRLYFPRNRYEESEDAEPGTVPAVTGPAESRDLVLLVVEDNDMIRQGVLLQLTKLGYRTLEASNAADALDILRSDHAISLMFSDVVMPGGMNGYELAEQALGLRPDLKVLLTSGFPGAILPRNEASRTSVPLLSKPYRMVDLAAKLKETLAIGDPP
ncbi:ATP-binding protein [Ferrovibrio sp.]|uniref:ATP-binding protein n=1 Tax=Ferrovibrio sp. TaxID=1917215 RepID=UPI000CB07EE4|nr:ATP-binding protein [Ferrovibrio sp.]PJI38523.1 MAG: hypothetical protein CTR53_16715 [Ferrovibrio sp.]